jgi:hypothetical protein
MMRKNSRNISYFGCFKREKFSEFSKGKTIRNKTTEIDMSD